MDNRTRFHQTMAFKISMAVIVLLLLLTGTMLYRSHLERLELISIYEDHLNEIAEATVQRRFRVSYEILNTGLSQVLVNPSVVEAFSHRDRNELYRQVSSSYESFEEVSICRFHFHLPHGETFLRVHKPQDYGDFLLDHRPMVRAVNSSPEKGRLTGMEHGSSGVALRSIAPVYHEGEYIGSVELGMCLGSRILEIFKNVSEGEWFLFALHNQSTDSLCGTRDESLFPSTLSDDEYQQLINGETIIETRNSYVIQKIPIQNFEGEYSHYLKREFDNGELIALQSRYTLNSIAFASFLSIFGLILMWLFIHRLLRPLTYLEQKARSFEAGTLIDPIEIHSSDEIGVLSKAMETMRKALVNRESSLKELSYKDQLTGVYNRRYFQLALKQFDEEEAYPLSIIIGDVDDLKTINDQYGHSIGDMHIQRASRVLRQGIRTTDVICRLGGDEFGILLPGATANVAREVIDRIESQIIDENLRSEESPLQISFGHSTCASASVSVEEKIDLADQAMYLSKSKKKTDNSI